MRLLQPFVILGLLCYQVDTWDACSKWLASVEAEDYPSLLGAFLVSVTTTAINSCCCTAAGHTGTQAQVAEVCALK